MNPDALIIAWVCLIDAGLETLLAGRRLRERGPYPRLTDSEVLTLEVVGSLSA